MRKVTVMFILAALVLAVSTAVWAAKPIGSGQCKYENVKVLVVLYTNTVGGTLSTADVNKIKSEVDQARTFYWRNSKCMCNLEITYMEIPDYKDISEISPKGDCYFMDWWDNDGDGVSVETDLYARGVTDNQYAFVFNFYAWGNPAYCAAYGGGTYGVELDFLGPSGACTAYCAVPACWDPDTYDLYFIHESLHAVDSIFNASGYPDFPSSDQPVSLAGDFGESYDFNAYILRSWSNDNWLGMGSSWGTQVTTADSDQDGLPNSSAALVATEATFGSSSTNADTDGDGLGDLVEYYAGIFSSSNPNAANTDGDGITTDGKDKYPLYNMVTCVPKFTPTINGALEAGWGLIGSSFTVPVADFTASNYACWDSNYLYLGFRYNKWNWTRIHIDCANDGWWHGLGNYEITFTPNDFSNLWSVAVLDCSDGQSANWRSDVLLPSDILYRMTWTGTNYEAELRIPLNSSTGLVPGYGDVVGYNVTYENVDGQGGLARPYEQETFVDLVDQPVYYYPLDTSPGWTTSGSWAFGTPTGGGSHNKDPRSGHTGTKVYGYNLNGDYANNMTTVRYLKTTAINCSGMNGVTLKFWRWLGVDRYSYDKANIQVSNNGTTWYNVWSNPDSVTSESSWSQQTYDISSVADWQPTVYIRWGMGTTNSSITYPGWNIDDVEILSTK